MCTPSTGVTEYIIGSPHCASSDSLWSHYIVLVYIWSLLKNILFSMIFHSIISVGNTASISILEMYEENNLGFEIQCPLLFYSVYNDNSYMGLEIALCFFMPIARFLSAKKRKSKLAIHFFPIALKKIATRAIRSWA